MAKTTDNAVNVQTGEVAPVSFTTKRVLNAPVLSQKGSGTLYVTILDAMAKSTQRNTDDNKEPATLVHVLDWAGRDMKKLVLSATQVSILNETYPDNGYVGCSFKINNLGKKEGKAGRTYNVSEMTEIQIDDTDNLIEKFKSMI